MWRAACGQLLLGSSNSSLAAALETAPAALPLLLQSSFALGAVQLPWQPYIVQQAYSTTLQRRKPKKLGSSGEQQWQRQQHQSKQRSTGKRQKHQHEEDSQELSWPGTAVPSSLRLSWRGATAQQDQGVQQQQHSATWHSSSSRGSSKRGTSATWPASYSNDSSRFSSSRGDRFSRVQQAVAADSSGPLLPSRLGVTLPDAGSSSSNGQLAHIPEGQLMALIRAARSIADMEQLLLQFHSQFR
jgi:hypothetical protein